MAKEMIDLNSDVKLDIRSAGDNKELIGINQIKNKNISDQQNDKNNLGYMYLIILIFLIGGFYGFRKLTKKVMP